MKKFMTLLTVLFVFITMSFGQTTIGNTTFFLNSNSDGFSVSINPVNVMNAKQSGVATITFDPAVDFVSMSNDIASGKTGNITEIKSPNGATNAIQFNYEDMGYGGVNITTNTSTIFNCFTENDTIDAYNNGVFSVPECVQDFTQADVDSIYQSGYENGTDDLNTIASNIDDIIDNYLTTNSINGSIVDNSLSIGPNPVIVGQTVTVNSSETDIDITVYNVAGQVQTINSFDNTFSTDNLTSGLYLVLIKKDDKIITNSNNNTFKLIVK